MPGFKRVSPEEVKSLLDGGYAYVDVRTEEEFERGHVPGAYNVPWRIRGPAGVAPNPDFLTVMTAAFGKDEKLVVGCQTGNRSLKAAEALAAAGFADLFELRTGFEGSRDAFGRLDAGWSKKGFPVQTGLPAGKRYADVREKKT